MFLRAVLDANVIISGLGWNGTCARVLDRARAGHFEALVCWPILEDVVDKLQGKLRLPADEVDQAIAELLGFVQLVEITSTFRAVPTDPDDDAVLETAVVALAHYVVTGDRRHLLPLGCFNDIRIVSPRQFLSILEDG